VEVEEGINNRCKKFRGLHIIQEELKYINRKKKEKEEKPPFYSMAECLQ
jgi:hypothetical protein